jgi:hypothetical protein
MATNVLRGKSRGTKPPVDKGLAIGEADARVFNCPACARPLSNGTWRCTGCGVRLVMGVTLRRALAILVLGMALGTPIGVVVTVSAVTLSLSGPPAAIAAVPTASPSPPPPTAAPASQPPVVTTVPASATSALSGTAVVNGRISVDAATLAATLKQKGVETIDIARALRSLAADAALGIDLTSRLTPWTEARDVQVQLDGFYRAMADTAKTGLRASLTDTAAYKKAGANMLTVIEQLGGVDAASRDLAESVDIELPPVVIPET